MNKVMLITGAAQRIGAYIAKAAHADGYNTVLHYRHSTKQTQALQRKLNEIRPYSCIMVQADFQDENKFHEIADKIRGVYGRIDVLVNNASEFFPTQLSSLTVEQYNKLFNSNVKGPLFLSKACYSLLKKSKGTIINLVDIHADKPLKNYPVYSMAKAANKMMVMALAKQYAPEVRVNGVSPGCIIWPEHNFDNKIKETVLERIALLEQGSPHHIYQAIISLVENNYITGQVINVDGGRSLNM